MPAGRRVRGVFRSAMIMANAASLATLDRYARGIKEHMCLFPQGRGVIAFADEAMRSEQWGIVQEDLISTDPAAFQALASPRGSIIGHTA